MISNEGRFREPSTRTTTRPRDENLIFSAIDVMFDRYQAVLGDPDLSQEALDDSVDAVKKGLLTSILELG
jgi:hypothetical protein